MGLFSFFRRKHRTKQASYTSYKSPRASYRKPFTPKITPLAPDRTQRRRSEKTGRFLAYVKLFAIFFTLGVAIYGIFFTPLLEIQSIDIKGEADTLQEQAALNTYLQDYLGENLLLFNTAAHEQALLEQYGYLKTLDIRRSLFHTISVTLETYPPVANVRVDFVDGSSQYYLINELGLVSGVGEVPGGGTTVENIPLIVMDVTGTDMDLPVATETPVEETTEETTQKTTLPTEINQQLISIETLTQILDTTKDFEGKFNMQVLEIHYLKRARELHLYTERYFYVWIDLGQDVSVQLAKLKKALTELNIYEAPLEYIDLRVSGQNGEKVIYKLSTSL